jgi:hypothetical protein
MKDSSALRGYVCMCNIFNRVFVSLKVRNILRPKEKYLTRPRGQGLKPKINKVQANPIFIYHNNVKDKEPVLVKGEVIAIGKIGHRRRAHKLGLNPS